MLKKLNSKSKGNSWEREVSKHLNAIFGLKDAFWKTSGSGSMTKFGHTNNIFFGDICAIDPNMQSFNEHFYIECKHLKNIELDPYNLNLKTIINKSLIESQNKYIFIFLKRNYKLPVVISNKELTDWNMIIKIDGKLYYVKQMKQLNKDDFIY